MRRGEIDFNAGGQRMRQRITFLTCALSAVCLCLGAGAATAGYWEVVYDLAGSNAHTTIINPANMAIISEDDDPITGSWTVQYEATSSVAPLLVGRLVDPSSTHVDISQSGGGILLITGSSDLTLIPPLWGTYGGLTGQTMNLGIVADSNTTGFIHCQAGACGLAGFVTSAPQGLTPSGSGPFPQTFNPLVFTGAGAGNGNWTNGTRTITVLSGAFLNQQKTSYQGQEVMRTWHVPEPTAGLLLVPGIAMLGLLGRLRRR